MGDFAQFISSKKSQCLQNEPRLQSSYQQVELCGNGIVEGREVCDCGKPEVSTNLEKIMPGLSQKLYGHLSVVCHCPSVITLIFLERPLGRDMETDSEVNLWVATWIHSSVHSAYRQF
jgi:hypothetical protein